MVMTNEMPESHGECHDKQVLKLPGNVILRFRKFTEDNLFILGKLTLAAQTSLVN